MGGGEPACGRDSERTNALGLARAVLAWLTALASTGPGRTPISAVKAACSAVIATAGRRAAFGGVIGAEVAAAAAAPFAGGALFRMPRAFPQEVDGPRSSVK